MPTALASHRNFLGESSSFKPWLSMLNACLKRPHISLFQGERIHDLFIKSYLWHLPLSYCLIHTPESAPPVFNCLPDNSPLWKREGTWNRNQQRPTIVSGVVTGDVLVSYWPVFFPVPSDSPRSLCEKKEMNLLGAVPISFLKWWMVYYQMNDCKCRGNRAKY